MAAVNVENCRVLRYDGHYILLACESADAAKRLGTSLMGDKLEGKILGHYLTSDAANEALNTMKTVAMFGYGKTLQTK